jgi:hypothetical protein
MQNSKVDDDDDDDDAFLKVMVLSESKVKMIRFKIVEQTRITRKFLL